MAPIRVIIMPCLELPVATVSAAVSNILQLELELEIDQEFFWTVFEYIKNEARYFHISVAHHV